ncbi:hypothetical protein V2O64_07800 [Verrucomicrobiaceae bacterium 227]
MKLKTFLKTALLGCGILPTFAVEFYSADFSVEGQGSTHDSGEDALETSPVAGANWLIRWDNPPGTDSSTNSFITSGGKLISSDWGGRAIFETEAIDVSGVNSVTISTLAETVGADVFNAGAEDFTWFYILDGGARVSQLPVTSDGSLDYSEVVDVTGVNSLVVGFEFEINGGGDGFEISSVRVDDVVPVALSMTLPERLAESDLNGGLTSGTGEVFRPAADAVDLIVTLESADTSEITVPATVTIPSGSASATFTVTAVDDAEIDGEQTVLVTGSSEGFLSASASVIVEDDEVALATISLSADPGSFSENGGTSTVTITVTESSTSGYLFSLSSSDVSELTVPATVTIPADAFSATFVATGVDDAVSDGTQSVEITATDSNAVIEAASVTISVCDDEAFAAPAIVINELRTDNEGEDINEYLEIYGATGDYSLERVWLVVLGDGSGEAGFDPTGVIERAYDLTGNSATGNYFLLGNNNMTTPVPDLTVGTGIFENNDALTFLLVTDFTGSTGVDLDTDNDGTLDGMPWGSVIDAVSFLDPEASDAFGYAETLGFTGANLAPVSGFTPAHLYRSPNGNGAWFVGAFGTLEEPGTDTPRSENGGPINPPDPEEVVIAKMAVNAVSGEIVLTVSGLGNGIYDVQSSTDLDQADAWANVTGNVVESDNGEDVNFTFVDPEFSGNSKLFYRIFKQ